MSLSLEGNGSNEVLGVKVKDRKVMKREFKELKRAIERLKRAEKELEALKPHEDAFGAGMESIRQNLKCSDKVEV